MQVPDDFGRAGWFVGGPAPEQVGPAVIAGHVDSSSGPAVLYRLGRLGAGDEGRRHTWVILVHGDDAARTETLRMLVTVAGFTMGGAVVTSVLLSSPLATGCAG
jgi:hypothetical protein